MNNNNKVILMGLKESPNVNRVQIALNLKGIDYEFMEVDLFKKSELLLDSNPVYKRIPVFIHEGRPLCESLIIVQYIDEVWNDVNVHHNILPSHPVDCATARFWASFLDNQWIPLMIKLRDGNLDEEENKKLIVKIKEGLVVLDDAFVKCSKGKPFFQGDTIGFIDIAFGGHLGWIYAMEEISGTNFLDKLNCPNLCKWAKRFSNDEVVKGVIPKTSQLIEILEVFRAKGWFNDSNKV